MVGEGVSGWEGDDEDFEATWAEWVAELGGYAKRFETRGWLAAYLQGLLGLTSVGFFMSHLRALVMIRHQGTWTGRARVPGNRGREVTADD